MDNRTLLEIIGTGAGILVALSLTMKNIRYLRIINSVGALVFAVYGLFIGAWAVFGLNTFILGINLFYILRLWRKKPSFAGLPVDFAQDEYTRQFLVFWERDIAGFNPGFDVQRIAEDCQGYFIMRDMIPVSLVLYRDLAPGRYQIVLDYAVPDYRDGQSGEYFYKWAYANLAGAADGSICLETMASHPAQVRYIVSNGFSLIADEPGYFRREVRR